MIRFAVNKVNVILLSVFFTLCFLSFNRSGQATSNDLAGWIDEERLLKEDQEGANWLSLGRNWKQQHYSPLDDINASNVAELGFAWEYDASSRIGKVPRGLEATPFVVDGVMYTSGAWGVVYALEADTGGEIWRYDPPVDPTYSRKACCDVVNRGVAVWKGKVYVGTIDGWLTSLDAATGEVNWRSDVIIDRTMAYANTGPPQIAGRVIVIGTSGADMGARGYFSAYDLETGKLVWRFFTVPGDPKNGYEHPEVEIAAKTWDPESRWEAGGGGTVWGQMTYDPELNLLYVGTSNGSPYPAWIRSPSGGDNLFLCSILAIDPDTGRLIWYYQETPGESWDYTATQNMILAELEFDGQMRKVLMQAPKNGFFYVLDRETGELLSAENFVEVNWASHIDLATGRPVFTGLADYRDEPKFVVPGPYGAHNWNPMSYSPETGLVYIPTTNTPMVFGSPSSFTYQKATWSMGLGMGINVPFSPEDKKKYADGQKGTEKEDILKAWDPVKQESVWEVKLPVAMGNGGILSTGGDLVFQGTNTGYFNVYHARTGKLLKELFTGTGIMAAPMTYRIDGVQYVAVMASYGGGRLAFGSTEKEVAFHKYKNYGRILAFRLGGGDTPLPPKAEPVPRPAPPDIQVNPDYLESGGDTFAFYCRLCHQAGPNEIFFSQYPDLSKMTEGTHAIFKQIVLDGVYAPLGMAGFADVLDEEQVEMIHHFLISRQKELWEAENGE